ncbi:hypothetical protein KA005_66160 [bacterium]|nr:hypothetical protein [bacterium]
MKTIKLETSKTSGIINQPYSTVEKISFSICTEIKDRSARMLTSFAYCREGVIGHFSRFFSEQFDREYERDYNDGKLYSHEDMPKNRTSMAVHFNTGKRVRRRIKELDSYMERSINLLNHYEKRNKWTLSEIYKAKHDAGKKDLIYLFKSSKWWMTAPHTLSLYMLLIRLGRNELFDKVEKSTSNSELLSIFRKANNKVYDSHRFTGNRPKAWNLFLDNRKEIYGKREQKGIFNFSSDSYTVRIDGISALCSGNSQDRRVKEKFKELCKENNLEI